MTEQEILNAYKKWKKKEATDLEQRFYDCDEELYCFVGGLLFRQPEIGRLREALLRIRKIRRDKLMPEHELDEIYNIAVDALNEVHDAKP